MSKPDSRAWLQPLLKPLRPIFREVLAMSFFINLLALAVPIFTLQVYDRVVASGGISTLQGLVVGMFLVLVFDYVLRLARSRIMQTVALRVDVVIGQLLFEKVMALPLRTLETQPGAHWQGMFRDVDTIRNTLSGPSAVLVADLPFAILFLILVFVIAAPIAWVLLIIVPMFMFVAWRSGAVLAAANKAERETTRSRDSFLAEIIAGRTTIKALALDRAMRPQWEEMHADNIERSIERGGLSDGYSSLGASLSMLTSIALTTVGALAIMDQQLTVGALIATNMLSGRILGPLNQLVGTWRTFSGFRQARDRLGQLFDTPGERLESEVNLDKPNGQITLENVTFSYSEDTLPAVDNVSITIKAGGIHALVGRNGSGKTTLVKIIQGLYEPSQGRVLLDDADLTQFTRSELADWIGYVPQESILFAGSVRDNIIHRIPDASDEDIIKAATDAGVHSFIIDMPDGYATDIGEAGQRLSGGQRQRIAIARALLGDPPVVVMDEPSSSLDRQAEQGLRRTITEIGRERTVIIITHSPILLAACDTLIAMDQGKVALAGPAKEILPRLFGGGKTQKKKPAPQEAPQPQADEAQKQPARKQPDKQAGPARQAAQVQLKQDKKPQQEAAQTPKQQAAPRTAAKPAEAPGDGQEAKADAEDQSAPEAKADAEDQPAPEAVKTLSAPTVSTTMEGEK